MKTQNLIRIRTLLPFGKTFGEYSYLDSDNRECDIVEYYKSELRDYLIEEDDDVYLDDFDFETYKYQLEVITKEVVTIESYMKTILKDESISIILEDWDSTDYQNTIDVFIEMQKETLEKCFDFIESEDPKKYLAWVNSEDGVPSWYYDGCDKNLWYVGETNITDPEYYRMFYNKKGGENYLEVLQYLFEYILTFYNEKEGINKKEFEDEICDYVAGNVDIDCTLNERLVEICKKAGRNDLVVVDKIEEVAKMKNENVTKEEKCAILHFGKKSEIPTIGAIFTRGFSEVELVEIIKKCLKFENIEAEDQEIKEAALTLIWDDNNVSLKNVNFRLDFEFTNRFTLEDY